MRLLGKGPSVDELVPTHDPAQFKSNGDVPVKAQKTLGAKGRPVVGRPNGSKYGEAEPFWNARGAEPKSLGNFRRSIDYDSDTVPGARVGAPLPNVLRKNPSSSSLGRTPNSSATRVGTHSQTSNSQIHQSSTESMNREYYDAAKQPLYVSQQTSASAVRDMGLRKGTPAVRTTASNPNLTARPLKSAMKQPKNKQEKDGTKKPKKLDLASLFPQPKSSNARMLSPAKFQYSPSAMTDQFDYFPNDSMHEPLPHSASARFDTQNSSKVQVSDSPQANATRVKIFEPDVYDNRKMTSRKPPKGIQNWFDGFDISSDEEEEGRAELPATERKPAKPTLHLNDGVSAVPASRERDVNKEMPANKKTFAERAQEGRHVEVRAQDVPKPRIHHQPSVPSITAESPSPGAVPNRKRSNESRLTSSRLGAESVLSLSSESDDDKSNVTPVQNSTRTSAVWVGNSSRGEQRPPEPTQNLKGHTVPSTEQSNHRPKPTHESFRSSESKSSNHAGHLSPQSIPYLRAENGGLSEPAVAALKKIHSLQGSASQPSRSRPQTGGTNDKYPESAPPGTSYSTPSDSSRFMAVTEEEMILLELMRQKRAAMQKSSFSEGYRLALETDKHNRKRSNDSRQDPSLLVLKREYQRGVGRERGHSRAESLLREELEQRKRYSAIRKEDVDKGFKMGRFLAMEQAVGSEKMSKMERFLTMAPGLASELADRPISGTEIDVESGYEDSRYGIEEETEEDLDDDYRDSRYEEQDAETELESPYFVTQREADETAYPQLPPLKGFSPMQKLTEQVRQSPGSSNPEEKRLKDDYMRIRAFLASSRASEAPSSTAFESGDDDKQSRDLDIHSALVPEGEPYVSVVDERTPKPSFQDQFHPRAEHADTEIRRAQHRPHPSIGDPRVKAISTPVGGLQHPHPYRPTPGLDFAPLELPYGRNISPSVATSRPSPLTPTFPAPITADKANIEIAGSDNSSFRNDSYLPEPKFSNGVSSSPATSAGGRRSSKKPPPRIDTVPKKEGDRVTSMQSTTSAGEDVLAAWAELGGGSPAAFAGRRKRPR